MKQKSSTIQSIINQAKKGKMFILVDNKDRENEGDLVVPASKINAKKINFMAKHGRGLICLALTQEKVKKLKLPLMSLVNKSRTQTAFTVSIEAKKGISTGSLRMIEQRQLRSLLKTLQLVKTLFHLVMFSFGIKMVVF